MFQGHRFITDQCILVIYSSWHRFKVRIETCLLLIYKRERLVRMKTRVRCVSWSRSMYRNDNSRVNYFYLAIQGRRITRFITYRYIKQDGCVLCNLHPVYIHLNPTGLSLRVINRDIGSITEDLYKLISMET